MNTTCSLTAIVLAAGRSRRMGEENKLLLDVGGCSVLTRVLQAFTAAPVSDIVVVTGAQHEAVASVAAQESGVRVIHNDTYSSGMASSIRCGVQSAHPESDAYAICPGDLPLLTAETVRRLCEAFAAHPSPRILLPTCDGRQGHPVIFERSFRAALLGLRGDRGAREVLRDHEQAVVRVPVDDEGIFTDVDTPAALRAVRKHLHRQT